jgi:hypothetical protein
MPYLDDDTWVDEDPAEGGEPDEFDRFLSSRGLGPEGGGTSSDTRPTGYESMSDEEFLLALDGDSYESQMRAARARIAAEDAAYEPDEEQLVGMSDAEFARVLAGVGVRVGRGA